jgi:hypothetical protein
MKVAILVIVAFFMLGTLSARELNLFNTHEQIETSKYEFGVSNFKFGKTKASMPGLTLFVNSKSLGSSSNFKVMFAKALDEAKNVLPSKINPEKSVLYAELSYKF